MDWGSFLAGAFVGLLVGGAIIFRIANKIDRDVFSRLSDDDG